MKPVIPFRCKVLAFAACAAVIHPAHAAWPVFDSAVLAAVNTVNASVVALNTSVTRMLYDIGTAINQNGQKTVSTIEAASKAQRDFDTVQETNRRLEDARQRYDIPSSICAESGAGSATEVIKAATSARAGLRPGGGAAISNAAIAAAINKPPVTQEADAARSTHIHTKYCDADDYAAYGGTKACPAISPNMPGGDKRFDTILHGAGPDAKLPDLTFSQEQSDVARMYIQNSVRRSVGQQLRKSETDTPAGIQYVGLMNQYNAIISAAAEPQEQRIAESLPNPATKPLLAEALTTPSANAYYKLIASPRAKAAGMMSLREFEAFEVGRRYANTEYQADLQAMSGDNLLRELIRVASLNNWLAMSLKNEIQKGTMISGLTLASTARREFEPLLTQTYQSVPGKTGK